MSLIEQARRDIARITTDASEFGAPIEFTSPSGQKAIIGGRTKKHHLSVGSDGLPVNDLNASISFSELAAIEAGYPIRNPDTGQVNLKGHTVSFEDSPGVSNRYVVLQVWPDETLGLIVCILGNFK